MRYGHQREHWEDALLARSNAGGEAQLLPLPLLSLLWAREGRGKARVLGAWCRGQKGADWKREAEVEQGPEESSTDVWHGSGKSAKAEAPSIKCFVSAMRRERRRRRPVERQGCEDGQAWASELLQGMHRAWALLPEEDGRLPVELSVSYTLLFAALARRAGLSDEFLLRTLLAVHDRPALLPPHRLVSLMTSLTPERLAELLLLVKPAAAKQTSSETSEALQGELAAEAPSTVTTPTETAAAATLAATETTTAPTETAAATPPETAAATATEATLAATTSAAPSTSTAAVAKATDATTTATTAKAIPASEETATTKVTNTHSQQQQQQELKAPQSSGAPPRSAVTAGEAAAAEQPRATPSTTLFARHLLAVADPGVLQAAQDAAEQLRAQGAAGLTEPKRWRCRRGFDDRRFCAATASPLIVPTWQPASRSRPTAPYK
ncbi:unnamed protein product, partial [Polarella glacialis]